MNSRLPLLLLLLLFIIDLGSSQNCYKPFQAAAVARTSDQNIIGQLETGHFSIFSPVVPVRYNSYRVYFRRPDHVPNKTDVGLSIIYIANYADPTGIDFSIRPIIREKFFDAFFVMSTKARWTLAHIHYVASSRQDFRTGFYVVNNNFLLQPRVNTTHLVTSVPLGTSYPPRQKFIVYGQLSGLKSSQLTFQLRINQDLTKIFNNTLNIGISVRNNKKPIQLVYVSYFAGMLGKMTIRLLGSGSPLLDFILKANDTKEKYDIYGMTGYNGDIFSKVYLNATRRRLLQASTDLSGMTDDEKRQYYLKKIQQSEIAETARPPNYNVNQALQPTAVQNFRRIYEVQGFGQILNDAYLEPFFGFSNQNGDSTNSKAATSFITSSSIAAPSAITTETQRKPCVTYEDCVSRGSIVTLKDGSSGCILCNKNYEYNSDIQKCECKKGYILQGSQCIEPGSLCGEMQIYKNGICYQLVPKKSICDPMNNQIFDTDRGVCRCKQDFTESFNQAGVRKCTAPCRSPGFLLGGRCTCPKDQNMDNSGLCVRCKDQFKWNPLIKTCECDLSRALILPNQPCFDCPYFSKPNQSLKTCQCVTGYMKRGEGCVRISDPYQVAYIEYKPPTQAAPKPMPEVTITPVVTSGNKTEVRGSKSGLTIILSSVLNPAAPPTSSPRSTQPTLPSFPASLDSQDSFDSLETSSSAVAATSPNNSTTNATKTPLVDPKSLSNTIASAINMRLKNASL